jgi:hypothetical protein
MYFQRLTKDEWDGFAYEDMGLEGFDVAPADGSVMTEQERKKKATSYRDAERRRTRTHIAAAYLENDLTAKCVTLRTDRSEQVDVLVLGSANDVAEIPEDWSVTMERLALGERYETVYAWMTLKNEAPLFVLRSSDEKAAERLNAFLADAIRFIKRKEESEAA